MNKNLLRMSLLFKKDKSNSIWVSKITQNRLHSSYSIDSTIDAADVARHSKLMNEWWDPNGPMIAIHSLNSLRVPFIRDGLVTCSPTIATPLKGKKILDIGCGGGILSESLAKLGADTTGVDASRELIDLAIRHSCNNPDLAINKPTYCCTSVEEHVIDHENYYDCVVASEVIEHVNNKDLFVKSCVNALKPGGRIFFDTPTRTILTQIFAIYVAENILNIVPKGTHQYEKLMVPGELEFMLEKCGCKVEESRGMFYNFIFNKWEWIPSQVFVFAIQARKLN